MDIIDPKLSFGHLTSRTRTTAIVLHHAEASNASIYDIDDWHKANGWTGIGYHYYIRKDGKVYKGRPDYAIGAHCLGCNDYTIGICAEGCFNTETMTPEQHDAIVDLIIYLFSRYGELNIKAHRELNSTDCPGKNYPIETIKNLEHEKKEGEITMAQYEELCKKMDIIKTEISDMKNDIDTLKFNVWALMDKEKLYNYNDENIPEAYREALTYFMNEGTIKGNENGELGFTLWDLRQLTIMYRIMKGRI